MGTGFSLCKELADWEGLRRAAVQRRRPGGVPRASRARRNGGGWPGGAPDDGAGLGWRDRGAPPPPRGCGLLGEALGASDD
eukprot:3097803-Pyramimonas_sp.AAC.1